MRHGQTSIFLKPFIVIIFALLLIFVIQSVFNFQVGVEEDKQRFDFLQNFQTTFLNVAGCLEPDRPATASRAVLSEDKLQQYSNDYIQTEPDCAEDYTYGYNVTVEHNCLYPITSTGSDCTPTITPYTFGETTGSTGDSLDNELTLSYPVLVQIKPSLRVPGTMRIELRNGDLERTYGFLNKVVRQGKQRGKTYSLSLSITNSQRLCTDGNQLCLGGDACIPIKTGSSGTSIPAFTLPPGTHVIDATYRPGPDELTVNGGVTGGC